MPSKPNRKPPTGGTAKRANVNGVALKPVRPGAGLELAYKKRLQSLLSEIHRSVMWWVAAEYKKHPPALAQDASPFEWLQRFVGRLRNKWMRRIEESAPKLAEYFASAIGKRSDAQLKKILKDAGWTINFHRTPAMNDVWEASIHENVSLIKSIAGTYLSQVEQTVSRGYANGYDLKRVTDELQQRFHVSKKRASFIARDQASKLNSQMVRARALENGLSQAIWKHSMAGKEPRRTHLEMDGEPFDLSVGMYDPDPKVKRHIQCGELINCRCTARLVVPFGRAWENNNPARSVQFVKPVKEQKIHKGYPGT